MHNINTLIDKYGERGKLNGGSLSVFVDTDELASEKRRSNGGVATLEFSGLTIITVFVKVPFGDRDILELKGDRFRVLKSTDIRIRGRTVYFEVILFLDDYDKDMEHLKVSLRDKGCNLPELTDTPAFKFKGRIKSVPNDKILEFARYGKMSPTHTISFIMYEQPNSNIALTDIIRWGDRRFEVLAYNNVNERDRIMLMETLEVING